MSTVVVIGTGLAGATAALTARAAGADVVTLSGPPGSTALWSGTVNLYGPTAPMRDETLPLIDAPLRATADRQDERTPRQRLERLRERRPHHPYTQLDLGVEDLSQTAREALAVLGAPAPLVIRPGALLATEAGTIVGCDGGAATLFGSRGGPLAGLCAWAGLHERLERYPTRLAAALVTSALGLDGAIEIIAIEWQPDGIDSPMALLQLLDRGPDAPGADEFIAAFRAAAARASASTLLVSPVLGRSFHRARQWCDRLSRETDATVVERRPLEEPIMGLRLWTFLGDALRDSGIRNIRGRASQVLVRGDGAITGLDFDTRDGRVSIDDVSAVVLATGRLTGGGIAASSPLRETTFGLPVRLDGQTLAAGAQPSELLGRRPWSDHPIMRVGLATDSHLRPLTRHNAPRWPNLFAAGRVLGGTNPAFDGTAEGVDLVTGRLAGLAAARGAR